MRKATEEQQRAKEVEEQPLAVEFDQPRAQSKSKSSHAQRN
jgi:hypothetical protein